MYRDMGKARDGVTLSEQVQKHKTSRPFIVVNKKHIYFKSSWTPGLFWGGWADKRVKISFPHPASHSPTKQLSIY